MHRQLSDEEFLSHFYLYKHGNKESLAVLVEANQGLVRAIADKHATFVAGYAISGGLGSEIAWDDLVQSGNVGLLKALPRFDPARSKFSTYAHDWIDKEIRLHINACLMIKQARGVFKPVTSVDSKDEESRRLYELCANDDYTDGRVLKYEEYKKIIPKLLLTLPDKHKRIVKLRFGLVTGEEMSYAKVGRIIGLSPSAVLAIVKESLVKLRHTYEEWIERGKKLIEVSAKKRALDPSLPQHVLRDLNGNQVAEERKRILDPYFSDTKTLHQIQKETGFGYGTLKRWVSDYRRSGVAGLVPGVIGSHLCIGGDKKPRVRPSN